MQAAGGGPGARPGPQPLSVGDALLYLDQVKIEFSEKPEIYNEFLDIMKNFKAQEIDTPGVIQRVSSLFRGYNKLILGFNTFLPEGYKIDLHQLEEMDKAHRAQEAAAAAAAAQAAGGGGGGGAGRGGPMGGGQGPSPPGGNPPPGQGQGQGQAPGGQGPPVVEFKQAKDYVTTIKKRFANEPHQATYKAFLKILHHYQEEQRNIMDVLEQVSALFADHPDLLKEFTYFLPDAVQEQAKERLNRAARESEMRKAQRQAEQQRLGPGGLSRRKEHRPDRRDVDKADRYDKDMSMRHDDRRQDEHSMRKLQKNEARKAKKRASKALRRDDLQSPYGYTIASERSFFDHVKDTLLGNGKAEQWNEFIKFLNLYSQDVLSRKDMLAMVQDVFGKHTDMFDEFKMILNARGATDSVQNDLWYSMPLSEIDFSQCRKCTPSYRALPKDYPKPPCSERSPEEETVLNDTWVSVPVGSEENYSFKHMRRNQYEEALFKCEDERFEIDMVIDSNTATIRVLEPLAEEIVALKAQEEADSGGGSDRPSHSTIQYKLDKRTLGTIHLNAITRIYGDHGLEVLELLRKNPAGAIPVVLRRLKQKDLEWRKARQDLNKGWKEVLERNYHKSLDHRSFYFTQQDKRAIMPRQLVQDIKERKADQDAVKAGTEQAAALNGTGHPPQGQPAQGQAPAAPGLLEGGPDKKKRGAAGDRGSSKAARITSFSGGEITPESLHDVFPPDLYGTPQMILKYPHDTSAPPPADLGSTLSPSSGASAPAPAPVGETIGTDDMGLHKDVYQLALYAVEHSNATAHDKERIARLWRDFFKWFLSLPDDVIAGGAPQEEPSGDKDTHGHKCLPAGEESFIGPQSLYVFFRLHHILYDRLRAARDICEAARVSREAKAAHPLKAMAMRNDDIDDHEAQLLAKHVESGYPGFRSVLMARLDNSFDPTKYEDGCRHLMGNKSYMLYTLDKVVGYLVKQLQHLADDEAFERLQEVYAEEKAARGGRSPTDYRAKAASALTSKGQGAEELYRMTYVPHKRLVGNKDLEGSSLLLMEYLGLADEGAANKGIASLLDEVRNMEEGDGDEEEEEEEEDEEGDTDPSPGHMMNLGAAEPMAIDENVVTSSLSALSSAAGVAADKPLPLSASPRGTLGGLGLGGVASGLAAIGAAAASAGAGPTADKTVAGASVPANVAAALEGLAGMQASPVHAQPSSSASAGAGSSASEIGSAEALAAAALTAGLGAGAAKRGPPTGYFAPMGVGAPSARGPSTAPTSSAKGPDDAQEGGAAAGGKRPLSEGPGAGDGAGAEGDSKKMKMDASSFMPSS